MNLDLSARMNFSFGNRVKNNINEVGSLAVANFNKEYIIKDIKTNDDEIKTFLFSLGCYKGESVKLISKLSENFVVLIKNARYSIDKDLAKAIII